MRFGLILGDQLHHQLATLKALDRIRDVILMAEVVEEATYVAHHPQKIALIFSAMRHFAKELKAEGWRVRYHAFQSDSPIRSLLDFVESQQQLLPVTELVITNCGEYRLQQQIEQHWSQQLQLPVQCLNDDRFFCSLEYFRHFASRYQTLRMEYFYREMRKRTGYLMQGQQPLGEQWNYDRPIVSLGQAVHHCLLYFILNKIRLIWMYLSWLSASFPVTLAALTTSAGPPHVAMLCLHWSISLPTVCHILAIIKMPWFKTQTCCFTACSHLI